MTKILIILLALCATALASPTPTSSASPSIDFTPMMDWRCTIDVAADRITLFDAKTGEYLASGPLSTWEKGNRTPDQLCQVAVKFSRMVIDKISPPDNNFMPMTQGGYTYANGHFETIVHVGKIGIKRHNRP